jgi:hypothetical protein
MRDVAKDQEKPYSEKERERIPTARAQASSSGV